MNAAKVEFQPESRKVDIKADKVVDKPAKDPTMTALLAVAVICIVVATVMHLMPRPTATLPEELPPPVAPPAPEPVKSTLTDRQIRAEKWKDNPGQTAQDLAFAAIFYVEDPAFRTAQFGANFKKVGEHVGEGDAFEVVRIDPHVVFLRDKEGKLHRLIEPGSWNDSIEEYSWTGDKRPPDPPVRQAGGDE